MTQPVVSRRSWQHADLSRTVDEAVLAIEYDRLQLTQVVNGEERWDLQRDASQIIAAVLWMLMTDGYERPVELSDNRSVVVTREFADELRNRVEDVPQFAERLQQLATALPNAHSLPRELVEVLDRVAEVADVVATTSLRPLMRK
jgi:hypothetical protein